MAGYTLGYVVERNSPKSEIYFFKLANLRIHIYMLYICMWVFDAVTKSSQISKIPNVYESFE